MTINNVYETVRNLTERIHVLEAERVNEKDILPLYKERSALIDMIALAEGVR